MASLLPGCQEMYQMYNEIDHIVQFASGAWDERGGGKRTRDPYVQPRSVLLTVGMEATRELINGPPRVGGASTPPGASAIGSRLPTAATTTGGFSNTRDLARAPRGRRGPCREISVPLPDFVLMESPTLAELHWANGGKKELGPVRRPAYMFPAVEVLLKLRWLVRLHIAIVSIGGARCSLQRLLVGILADTCAAHPYPHSPVQFFEHMVETLKARLDQKWPLFLAFVSAHDEGPSRMSGDGVNSLTNQSFAQMGSSIENNPASLWQTVDNIFVAWLVQKDPAVFPANQVLQELDFYGLAFPLPETFDGLRAWQAAKDIPGVQVQFAKQAQREAHHFALLLEAPSLRQAWEFSSDEVLEMARNVAAYPTTFNPGVRARITFVLKGGTPVFGESDRIGADDFDVDQMTLFLSYTDGPRDAGRLKPVKLETLRDNNAPWLVGNQSRFKAALPIV